MADEVKAGSSLMKGSDTRQVVRQGEKLSVDDEVREQCGCYLRLIVTRFASIPFKVTITSTRRAPALIVAGISMLS